MALTNPAPESGEDSDGEALLTTTNDKHVIDEDHTLLDKIAKRLKDSKVKNKLVVPYPISWLRLSRKGGM